MSAGNSQDGATGGAGRIILDEDGHIAMLTLSNPARRNAMSAGMWQALKAFATDVDARTDVRVIVVRGEGTLAFSAGADISDFASQRADAASAQGYDDLVEDACRALEAVRAPTIALIHGACLGAGSSIAASCDIRVASSQAYFAVPAARLGLGYDPRGIARFLRVFGRPATQYLLYTASRLEAHRAAGMGVVMQVAPPDEIDAEAMKLAVLIAANAPLTLAAAKVAIRALSSADGGSLAQDVERLYKAADASEDYREGRQAFAEKRPPRFSGR
ncbi:MAG: enoyl-CoA hydratase-related protein [Hyphomicrobiaceae bacterium]